MSPQPARARRTPNRLQPSQDFRRYLTSHSFVVAREEVWNHPVDRADRFDDPES